LLQFDLNVVRVDPEDFLWFDGFLAFFEQALVTQHPIMQHVMLIIPGNKGTLSGGRVGTVSPLGCRGNVGVKMGCRQ
jgi:hypothetical protein